jgi:pimeloyl-ACP methyl ester carboxylesterase
METLVNSQDGTAIGYRTTGSGPGLVAVHGAIESAAGYQGFADVLGEWFTVHVIDRRGRGLSGPHGEAHTLRTEVEDVRAVVEATGSQRLFGVSSGALIALEAALTVPGISHVAAYEPPITAPGRKDHVFERFEREVRTGRSAEAMVTILTGLEVGPRFLRLLPRPLLVTMMRRFMEGEDDVVGLLPTALYDFRVVEEGSKDLERFTALPGEVLLAGGSRSPRYLKDALVALEGLVPNATRVELRGADHNSSTERPQLVAAVLRGFLSSGG